MITLTLDSMPPNYIGLIDHLKSIEISFRYQHCWWKDHWETSGELRSFMQSCIDSNISNVAMKREFAMTTEQAVTCALLCPEYEVYILATKENT